MNLKGKNEEISGITLLSLVITIIILLILAGVTLNLVIGEDGIIGKAEKSVEVDEIVKAEEQANIEYSNLLIDGYASQGVYSEPSLKSILENLRDNGYISGFGNTATSSATEISLNKNSYSLQKNGTATLTVSLTNGNEADGDYYATINGNNYFVQKQNDKIVINKDKAILPNYELSVTSSNEDCVTTTISENTVNLVASANSTGNSTITVSYGDKTATCSVTVADSSTSFSTAYGKIDVIWLDTSNNVISSPNAPNMATGMTSVSWTYNEDDEVWTEDSTTQSNWYDYASNNWANAKNDGSYFVWIPRFAYRITYYSSSSSSTPTGYYDGKGMYKADGTVKYGLDEGIKTVEHNNEKYIVHPAFETNLDNGGWSSELAGFWIAKYEVSRSNASDSSIGSGTTFKSVPNVQSARSITVGDMYTYSLNYDSSKKSHLIKNSEWGAVAYLTHSQYGRNGTEIDINNSSSYITGNGGGSTNADQASGTINAYNTALGAKASTTGNIYGVYDMSGGAWERTAAWDTASEHNRMNNGSSFASTGGKSTKYATAYSNGSTTYYGTEIYVVGKIGEATKETYVGSGGRSWFSDYAWFAWSEFPFFVRGGYCAIGTADGVFSSWRSTGDYGVSVGFRVTLCP